MPPSNFPEELLILRQCQKCYVSEAELKSQGKLLLICAGCKKALYCTRECQKSDWNYHKTFCKINRDVRDKIRAGLNEKEAESSNGYTPREMEHRLRNWIELNRPDIQDAAVCALKLHEKPDNVLTHLLLITLTPSFKPREKSVDPRRAFTIQLLQPALISKQVPRDRGNVEGIAALMTKSNEWRKKGYVGLVIMMIMVTEPLTMAHISPFGLQDVKDVPYDPEWKANLTRKTSALPEWILPMSCDADEAL